MYGNCQLNRRANELNHPINIQRNEDVFGSNKGTQLTLENYVEELGFL